MLGMLGMHIPLYPLTYILLQNAQAKAVGTVYTVHTPYPQRTHTAPITYGPQGSKLLPLMVHPTVPCQGAGGG